MPFPGFSKKALSFFRQLEKNNARDWFTPRKSTYEELCREPMIQLSALLCEDLRSFAADHIVDPKKSVYRVYRDTRFSKDKTPYKNHVAAMFPAKDLPKHAGAVFYLQVSHQSLIVAGGMYLPGPPEQLAVRRAIAANPVEWTKLVTSKTLVKKVGPVLGNQFARVPKEFPPDHPAADYLRMKQWYFDLSLPAAKATEPGVRKTVTGAFQAMAPVIHWLNSAVRAASADEADSPSSVPKRPAPMF